MSRRHETATWLREKYLSKTNPNDAVGEKRYAPWASYYTGATLDLRATYEWGLQDLAQINERMWRVARKINPDAKTLRQVADELEVDPKYQIVGVETLLEKLQSSPQIPSKHWMVCISILIRELIFVM
ncbi:MAG: DUF885 family protein [Actinomycetota bacterium]